MKKSHAIVGAAAVLMALSSCTAASDTASAPNSSASPPPVVTPTAPLFVELSKEQAATRYLDLVCSNNAATRELTEAFAAGEDELLNGGDPDPAAAKAAAAKRIGLSRQTLELIDDDFYRWPDGIDEQLAFVRSSYLSELSTLDSMANAASFRDAYYSTFPGPTPEQAAAGQEIRYRLGLDVDTVASCVGHEDGTSRLIAERDGRTAEG